MSAWIFVLKSARTHRRLRVILTSGLNSLGLPLISPLFSFLVIRLASVELWGQFVPLLIVAQLAAHLAGWGNKDYLLREFSLNPSRLAHVWQSSLLTRLALLALFPLAAAALGYPPLRAGLLLLCCLALLLDQAYDVVVLYRRDFLYSMWVEVASLLLLAVPVVWVGPRLSVDQLLAAFGLSNLVKAGLFWLRYRGSLATVWQGRFSTRHLRQAFPFFLLGFSGLVQSRVDLYFVSFQQPESQVAAYQVFTNWMIYGQSASAVLLMPFVKGLYRLPARASLMAASRLSAAGGLLLLLFLPACYVVLTRWYRLPIPPAYLLLGGLFIFPIYFYLPVIYALFRAGQPGQVIAVNFVGAGVSAVLILLLMPGLGLAGALAASAAAQWTMGLLYWLRGGRFATGGLESPTLALPKLPRAG